MLRHLKRQKHEVEMKICIVSKYSIMYARSSYFKVFFTAKYSEWRQYFSYYLLICYGGCLLCLHITVEQQNHGDNISLRY